jgi:cytochrome P450
VTGYGQGGEEHERVPRKLGAYLTELIASGTLALLTHPGELARVRRDASLLPAAVEELLRFTNPVKHATPRFTTEEVRIGGVGFTTAWALPWPAWKPRSPSAP